MGRAFVLRTQFIHLIDAHRWACSSDWNTDWSHNSHLSTFRQMARRWDYCDLRRSSREIRESIIKRRDLGLDAAQAKQHARRPSAERYFWGKSLFPRHRSLDSLHTSEQLVLNVLCGKVGTRLFLRMLKRRMHGQYVLWKIKLVCVQYLKPPQPRRYKRIAWRRDQLKKKHYTKTMMGRGHGLKICYFRYCT